VVRQLLTESVLLGLIGGALGLLLAKFGTVAALAAMPRMLPRAEEIGLDYRVLLFTLVISVLAGVVFGLAPAWKTAHANLGGTLKETGRGVAGKRSRAQSYFVVGEMAMALVLLIGAGLMLRTLVRLWGLIRATCLRLMSPDRSPSSTFPLTPCGRHTTRFTTSWLRRPESKRFRSARAHIPCRATTKNTSGSWASQNLRTRAISLWRSSTRLSPTTSS
jgi:hypothetical protein